MEAIRPWENSQPCTTTIHFAKQKQLTTGTSWLNHSLGLADAMGESKKLFSPYQKGEADHLQDET